MKAGLLLGALASLALAACSAPAGSGAGSALPQAAGQSGRTTQSVIGGGPNGFGVFGALSATVAGVLGASATLTGTVVNQAGDAVAGATVSALLSGNAVTATTNANGSFGLPVTGIGVYVLSVNNANATGADSGAAPTLSVTVSAGQTGTISVGTLVD